MQPKTNEIEEEFGLFIRRRSLFATVTAIIAGSAFSPATRAFAQMAEEGALSLEQFFAEVNPIARRLMRDSSLSGQDRYLLTLASYAVRLANIPVPQMRDSGQGAGAAIGVNPGGDPFVVLHWRLAPHGRIRPHAHTYGNVITLGLEGEATVENFEVLAGTPTYNDRSFIARRTRTQRLTPGAINLVNLERDYVHGFSTGATGMRGLDITTRLRERAPTPYLHIESNLAGRENEFVANWRFDST